MFNAPPARHDLAASLIAALPDGVVARDARGRIVEVNPRFCQISGYARDELLDRPAPFPFESDTVLVRKGGERVAISLSTGRLQGGGTCQTVREAGEPFDEELNRAVLDSLPAHVAVIDRDGRIIAVNAAWTSFAADNRGPGATCGVGSNYLTACRCDGLPADAADGRAVAEGIISVLEGRVAVFTREYPCHAPHEQRWFLLTVAPLKLARGADGTGAPGAVVTHFNITARKRHEQQLAGLVAQVDVHRRRVDELIATVPGVVWEARATPGEAHGLRMEFVSAYVERMLGYTVGQWLATPDFWLSIVHPSDRDRVARETAAALAGGKGMRIDFRWTRKDGKRLWVEATSTVLFDELGRPIGLRGVTVDVTAQRRARRALKKRALELVQLARDLKKSNEELDQFAYIASHDLRAPLRGIANLSRWIEEDLGAAITPESRRQMELLRGRVNRMESLITGLLDYSRVGRVKTAPERVDVGRLVAEVVDLLAPRAGVTVEVAPDMPVLRARRLPLQQVLMNLIGNALKHNTAAQSLVRVTARRSGGRGAAAMWEFAVADNGPGIAPEYHGRIFVIFQTLQARDKVEGAGIGLSLVKKIVESEGGTIRVDSREGAGATFTFTWPETPKGAA